MKKRKDRTALDLDGPQKPGEVIWSPLQQSRALRFVISSYDRIRRALKIGTIVLVVALVVYVIAQGQQNRKLQRAIDNIEAVRTVSQANNCNTLQEFQLAHNAFVRGVEHLVTTVFTATATSQHQNVGPDSPVRKFIDELNNGEGGLSKNIVRVRDCTPEGIEKYNEQRQG